MRTDGVVATLEAVRTSSISRLRSAIATWGGIWKQALGRRASRLAIASCRTASTPRWSLCRGTSCAGVPDVVADEEMPPLPFWCHCVARCASGPTDARGVRRVIGLGLVGLLAVRVCVPTAAGCWESILTRPVSTLRGGLAPRVLIPARAKAFLREPVRFPVVRGWMRSC